MSKIKIIDLLNMISKCEEVPNKIKYSYTTFNFDKDMEMYDSDLMHGDLLSYIDGSNLNDEVEIIEEDKEIKKIEKLENKIDSSFENANYSERMRLTEIVNKLNEIIDEINKLKENINV